MMEGPRHQRLYQERQEPLEEQMTDNKTFVLAMRKADQRQLRHFADRSVSPTNGKTPS